MGFPYSVKFKPGNTEPEEINKNNTIQWYWLNEEGDIARDKVLEQQGAKKVVVETLGAKNYREFNFFGEPLYAMQKSGIIATGQSTQFNITIWSSDGSRQNIIQLPFDKAPLKRETLVEDYKSTFGSSGMLLNAYKTMDLPETWHALDEIFFDDESRLWVSAIVSDLDVFQWFIFDIEGQLLAQFIWPRDKPIQEVKNGYMYTSEGEIGVRKILRYKIAMDEKKGL